MAETISGLSVTEYHRRYYYIRRQKLLDYLGGHCVICKSTEDLHFDHVDPTKKSFEISSNLTLNDEVRAELDKCQLLCAPHHIEKTVAEKESFIHGTVYAWMKKKCECSACSTARRAWHDSRNEARRLKPGQGVRGPYRKRAPLSTARPIVQGSTSAE